MKLAFIFVPLGIALAVAGGILFYASMGPAPASATEKPYIIGEIRHPISPDQLKAASSMAQRVAPFFKVRDAHGIDVQIGGTGKKPQFVYFILDGCPCSLDAQPLFNRMYQRYKDKVDFIGVITSERAKAIDFAGMTTLLNPLVCDPDCRIARAYKAPQSTYSAIIRPDGTIERLYPGYSQAFLHDINRRLALLTGVKETPFDAAYAPDKPTSGCYLYASNGSDVRDLSGRSR